MNVSKEWPIITYTIKPEKQSLTRPEEARYIVKPYDWHDDNGVITFKVGYPHNIFTCYPGTYEKRNDGLLTIILWPDHVDLMEDHSRADFYLDSLGGLAKWGELKYE